MQSPKFTIVIPIGPGENKWPLLLEDLNSIQSPLTIVLAATETCPDEFQPLLALVNRHHSLIWLADCKSGRANQLNTGAANAKSEWLTFLHADSRLTASSWKSLESSIASRPAGLHYFNLQFDDKSMLMRLTELGVRLRCRTWGKPYGDQGFTIKRSDFDSLGGFPLIAKAEDHAFAWLCRRAGLPLYSTGSPLTTSARKYRHQGWGYVALSHNVIGMKQAVAFRFLQPVTSRIAPVILEPSRRDVVKTNNTLFYGKIAITEEKEMNQ